VDSKENGRLKFVADFPVSDLKPYERNPRKNDGAVEAVAKSIEQFGFNAPIIVDQDYRVCVGHTRLKAAIKRGLATVPVLVVSDLTGDKFKGYNIADNQTGTIAEWDDPVLWAELQELERAGMPADLLGFDEQELRRILAKAGVGGTDADDAPVGPPPEVPVTQAGDLWIMGTHRLLCGDATQMAAVNSLLDSAGVDLCVTSPPYNCDIAYTTYDDNKSGETYLRLIRQVVDNVHAVLSDGRFVSWNVGVSPKSQHIEHANTLTACGFVFYRQIVWAKQGVAFPTWHNTVAAGQARRYHPNYTHEMIYLFSKGDPAPGGPCDLDEEFANDVWKVAQSQSTVDLEGATGGRIPATRSHGSHKAAAHPAAFPVSIPIGAIKHLTSENEIVYDPFVGSGTTIIAAERLGRRCFAMEIDPGYCDVTVNRWEKATGKKAERLAGKTDTTHTLSHA